MKRVIKIVLSVSAVLLIAIQFLPRDHNETGKVPVNDISKVCKVPGDVQVIFKNSCYDCHSNNTRYPFYARIQPMRLMMDWHVRQGKEDLNFNEFATYTSRKQRSKLRAIGESLEEGSMPLSSYTLIHRSAILSDADKTVLSKWVKQSADSLLLKN